MATPYPIRPITEDEVLAAHAVSEHAFHGGPQSDQARACLVGLRAAVKGVFAYRVGREHLVFGDWTDRVWGGHAAFLPAQRSSRQSITGRAISAAPQVSGSPVGPIQCRH